MSVRMIRKSWWVDFRANHTRYRKRSPENSRAGALAYEAVLRQNLARGESIDKGRNAAEQNPTFEEFAWRWFDQYVVANNKFSEQYAKRKILSASLIPFFGSMQLRAVSTNHIEQFKARQVASGVSNKTINNRLTVFSKCLRCAHEWLDTGIPTIKLLRCPPPKTDYLTTAECELLLTCAKGQLQEMVLLALRTGMRQGEIRGLQWSSIDWQTRSLTVRHSRCDRKRALVSPKSNRERHIPIDADVYEMLFRRKRASGYVFMNDRAEPFTCHRLNEDLGITCRSAQVRKITWHVLRHTFATQLTLRGVPLTVVKELLGHSTIAMTMRYSHVVPSALRSAIEVLNPKNAAIADFGQPVGNKWQQIMEAQNTTH
jgi:integrase